MENRDQFLRNADFGVLHLLARSDNDVVSPKDGLIVGPMLFVCLPWEVFGARTVMPSV